MKQFKLIALAALLATIATACGDDDPNHRVSRTWVDLGLSVKWATTNVGSTEPAVWGGLYGWSDSSGLRKVVIEDYPINVSWRTEGGREITTVDWHSPYFGGRTPLNNITGTEYDIARFVWNSDWRVPTLDEWQELIDRCQWTPITSMEGAQGTVYRVTGPNGNSIIIPLGGFDTSGVAEARGTRGYYWTANLLPLDEQEEHGFNSTVPCAAWAIEIAPTSSSSTCRPVPQVRHFHLSVRPVSAK